MTLEAARLQERVREVVREDGGCWTACSGCQEGVDGYVSTRDYPYSSIFQCQPGGGCHECGGIGVRWTDGAFLASYGDALSEPTPSLQTGGQGRDIEAAAWAWLEKRFGTESDDPVDRAYGADEMVDAFHAGRAALSPSPPVEGEER